MAEDLEPTPLDPAQPLERSLAGGGIHRYQLRSEAGWYVRVSVEQRGVDVALHLFGTAGEPLTEVDSPTGDRGFEHISWVAEPGGEYRLEVRAARTAAPDASYRLVVEAHRWATATDRCQVEAERALAQGDVQRRAREWEAAITPYREALRLTRELGDQPGEALALYRLGWVHYQLEKWPEAIAELREAADRYQTLGDVRGEGQALNRLGSALYDSGKIDQALAPHERAFELFKSEGYVEGQGAALNNQARVHQASGRLQEALARYEEAIELFKRSVRRRDLGIALCNQGDLYLAQDRRPEARDAYEAALLISQEVEDQGLEALALAGLGDLETREGLLTPARAHLERAISLQEGLSQTRPLVAALGALGRVQLEEGQLEAAKGSFDRALSLAQKEANRTDEAFARTNLGRYLQAAGRPEEAVTEYQAALTWFTEIKDLAAVAQAHYGVARARMSQGNPAAAAEEMEVGLPALEDVRANSPNLRLRSAFFASKQHYWELYLEALFRLHEEEPYAGHERRAFDVSERRRARSLLEEIADGESTVAPSGTQDLLAKTRALRAQINALDRRRRESQEAGRTEQASSLEREIRQRLALLDSAQGQLRQAFPRRDGLVHPAPLSLQQLRDRGVLEPNHVLLEISLGEERSFLWVVTVNDLKLHALPGRADLEALARAFAEAVAQPGESAKDRREIAGRELSRLLLLPAAQELDRRRMVIVVPDGALHRVPFAALKVPGTEALAEPEQYLVAAHEIVTLPSASVLPALRRGQVPRQVLSHQPRLAALADPAFSPPGEPSTSVPSDLAPTARSLGFTRLAPLPGARREVEAIVETVHPAPAEVAYGFDATKALLLDPKMSQARILHLATHTLVDPLHPELSGVVLSLFDRDGNPLDGFLRLHEIYDLKLGANLVVLSACETGVGAEQRGEGLLSLARGFFHAGASQVVMSLWKVDDDSTAELMQRFYRQLFEEGSPTALALARAQRELLESGQYQEPYHWAGFVFSGDFDRKPDDDIEEADTGGTAAARRIGDPMPGDRVARERVAEASRFYFNGVDGTTGDYLVMAKSTLEVLELIWACEKDPGKRAWLETWISRLDEEDPFRRLAPWLDARKLGDTGWGVVYGPNLSPMVRQALDRLVDWRREQVLSSGGKERYVQFFDLREGESAEDFLLRHHVQPDAMVEHPEKMPYYLLLVGGPESISFRFQRELGFHYAVGRLSFENEEDYRCYVQSVIDAERKLCRRNRTVTYFAPCNPGDRATEQMAGYLVAHLAGRSFGARESWRVEQLVGEGAATKARLRQLLRSSERPALVLTATHGLGFPLEDGRMKECQGALVCQDWRGPGQSSGLTCDQYFTASDLRPEDDVAGMIWVLLACHSAGTPERDSFDHFPLKRPQRISPKPLLSRLPQRLLSHRDADRRPGAALAVIGHVDRSNTGTFSGSDAGEGVDVLHQLLKGLVLDLPVGEAMQALATLYNQLAKRLNGAWEDQLHYESTQARDFARLWTTHNDARNFILLGDPAVRLAV